MPLKIVKRVVKYSCVICKSTYKKREHALKCEAMPLEKIEFSIGDPVRNKEIRTCHMQKKYYFEGSITKVKGPMRFDEEYSYKWLGGKGSNMHVYQYLVSYTCPVCKDDKQALYYSSELELLNKPS